MPVMPARCREKSPGRNFYLASARMFCFCSEISTEISTEESIMRKIDRQGAAVLAFGWALALLVTLT
jgi:hypothetical protein